MTLISYILYILFIDCRYKIINQSINLQGRHSSYNVLHIIIIPVKIGRMYHTKYLKIEKKEGEREREKIIIIKNNNKKTWCVCRGPIKSP